MPERGESWQPHKIGDLLWLEYGRALDNYRADEGKYDVYGTNGKIGLSNSVLYDKSSLVIGRKGAYRGVHLAKGPFYVIDTAFYTKTRDVAVDIEFLYYWFKCIDINAMDSGSAIPSTSREEVYDLDLLLPGEPEQRAIATTLRSLDEKIDLLRRQNQTLEAMAETLFRQWFDNETAPNWPEGTVEDLFVLQRGYDLPIQDRIDGPHPIVTSSGLSGGHHKCT